LNFQILRSGNGPYFSNPHPWATEINVKFDVFIRSPHVWVVAALIGPLTVERTSLLDIQQDAEIRASNKRGLTVITLPDRCRLLPYMWAQSFTVLA
jgi:hypothetical protein